MTRKFKKKRGLKAKKKKTIETISKTKLVQTVQNLIRKNPTLAPLIIKEGKIIL